MESNKPKFDTVLVLDFGGQYCHLIARRIREEGIYSEIIPCEITSEELLSDSSTLCLK